MRILFISAALLLISGCTDVPIKDAEWCADKGRRGATCWHTLDVEAKRQVTKTAWDNERFGQVCAKPQVFADAQAAIETFCQNTNSCDYQVKTKIQKFSQHLKEAK
jgi:hypothetical protein